MVNNRLDSEDTRIVLWIFALMAICYWEWTIHIWKKILKCRLALKECDSCVNWTSWRSVGFDEIWNPFSCNHAKLTICFRNRQTIVVLIPADWTLGLWHWAMTFPSTLMVCFTMESPKSHSCKLLMSFCKKPVSQMQCICGKFVKHLIVRTFSNPHSRINCILII